MILAFAAYVLTCSDAQWIIAGIVEAEGLNAQQRLELITEVAAATDGSCSFAELPDRSTEKVSSVESEGHSCR